MFKYSWKIHCIAFFLHSSLFYQFLAFKLDEIGIPAARDIVDDVGNITVPSDVATLTTVFKMEIRHTLGRRKRSFVAEDVNLINSSSTFGLRWSKQLDVYCYTYKTELCSEL